MRNLCTAAQLEKLAYARFIDFEQSRCKAQMLLRFKAVVATLKRSHNILYVLLGMCFCIFEVVGHNILGIETKIGCHLRLFCVVEHQELICANLLSAVNTLR